MCDAIYSGYDAINIMGMMSHITEEIIDTVDTISHIVDVFSSIESV